MTEFRGFNQFGIALDEVPSAAVFIHMRNILFTSSAPGTEAALLYIYRVLQTMASERELQQQLQREYGMDMWKRMQAMLKKGKAPYKPPKISRAEMEVTVGYLKQTPRFTEELAGYKAGSGKISLMGITVGPNKDVMVEVQFPADAAPPPTVFQPSLTKKATGAKAVGPNFGQ